MLTARTDVATSCLRQPAESASEANRVAFVVLQSAPFVVERFGHKISIWCVACIAWLGVILEASSSSIAQFIVGRVVIYFRHALPPTIASADDHWHVT